MPKHRPDLDRRQYYIDCFLTPNRARLDDRFVLRDGKKHPFAVICPGGAYRKVCSYIEGVPIARELNRLGYSAVIVYYRVGRKTRLPAPQEDLVWAVREILSKAEEWSLEPEGYSVWGFSAGGHLAACFGTKAYGYAKYRLPKPAALVLAYPVITMEKACTHRLTHDLLLGQDATPAQERSASVENLVDAEYPPCFLWCGEADTSVPPENSRRLVRALEKAGVPFRVEEIPGVGHGVGPGTGTAAEGWIRRAAEFWEKQREESNQPFTAAAFEGIL